MLPSSNIRKMPCSTANERINVYKAIIRDVDNYTYHDERFICHKLYIAKYGRKVYAEANILDLPKLEAFFPEFFSVFKEYQRANPFCYASAWHEDRVTLLKRAIKLCELNLETSK